MLLGHCIRGVRDGVEGSLFMAFMVKASIHYTHVIVKIAQLSI